MILSESCARRHTWPVPDKLLVQVPEAQADAMLADLTECMTTSLVTATGEVVPIVAEADAPTHRWGE